MPSQCVFKMASHLVVSTFTIYDYPGTKSVVHIISVFKSQTHTQLPTKKTLVTSIRTTWFFSFQAWQRPGWSPPVAQASSSSTTQQRLRSKPKEQLCDRVQEMVVIHLSSSTLRKHTHETLERFKENSQANQDVLGSQFMIELNLKILNL